MKAGHFYVSTRLGAQPRVAVTLAVPVASVQLQPLIFCGQHATDALAGRVAVNHTPVVNGRRAQVHGASVKNGLDALSGLG